MALCVGFLLIPLLDMVEKLAQVRSFMRASGIDAWVIYDFRGCDSTGKVLLGSLTPQSRQYAIVIAQDDPVVVVKPRIESHGLEGLTANIEVTSCRTQVEFENVLKQYAKRYRVIAANFSSNPQTDVLPAGRFALLRSALPTAKWVSGENLMQIIHSVLSKDQLTSQENAAKLCTQIMEQAFELIAERVGTIREADVASYILTRFEEEGLTSVETPIVAIQDNTANPHYTPSEAIIRKQQLVLIDLWAKHEVFADITWMGYTGARIPPQIQTSWDTVLLAREAATHVIKPHIPGALPDERAREVLIDAGFNDAILHRTGHSIDTELHGKGANLDSFEMPETRVLLPNTVVSVEPGIYFPQRYGIRSEVDVIVTANGSKITTPPQESIVCI